ncbi:MAG: hypothetical protein Q8936_12635 [Bacillota bacterium]|nr:hypothetical protein [Bacillota bacterium]
MHKESIDTYLKFVEPYYDDKEPGYNFSHIERITSRLEMLSQGAEEHINYSLLNFIACFHGLTDKISEDLNFKEATIGFLRDLGWTENEIDNGLILLDRHLKDPRLIEEKIVHDANYMDLLGPLGIAKAFTTGGARGQCIQESADIFEYEYLDTIEFKTTNGQKLSFGGRQYAKEFLKELRESI